MLVQAGRWVTRAFCWMRTMPLTLALRIVRDTFVYPESGLIWCLRELVLALLTRSTGLVRAYGLWGSGIQFADKMEHYRVSIIGVCQHTGVLKQGNRSERESMEAKVSYCVRESVTSYTGDERYRCP